MLSFGKKFKVSYSYPMGHPVKVVIERYGRQGLLGWLYQKYASQIKPGQILISERIVELSLVHQWFGKIFDVPKGEVLEIGHVASTVSLELASLGFQVTGIDLRQYPFQHTNLQSVSDDFLSYEFNKKFDCIYSLSTIEHFGFNKRYGVDDHATNSLDEQAFSKIAKLLKSNGHAIISVPYTKIDAPSEWFRIYTRNDLEKKLEKSFLIDEKRFYSRKNNVWTPVLDPSDDPVSAQDGVALFLLSSKV